MFSLVAPRINGRLLGRDGATLTRRGTLAFAAFVAQLFAPIN